MGVLKLSLGEEGFRTKNEVGWCFFLRKRDGSYNPTQKEKKDGFGEAEFFSCFLLGTFSCACLLEGGISNDRYFFLISHDETTSEYSLGDLQSLSGRGIDVFVALVFVLSNKRI